MAIPRWEREVQSQMDKQQVLQSLGDRREQLRGFAVKTLWLFGSVARDEANAESDVDLTMNNE